jgi:hypothetical protein
MISFYKFNKLAFSMLILAVMGLASCKVEQINPVNESVKDITGTWQVTAATRNGTDLTTLVDFTQFKVQFSSGNYSLINPLPFIVDANGKYSLDNPKYPFEITFTATGATPVATAFNYPIVNGVRILTLTFSPGCPQNVYVYTLKKVNITTN